MRKVRETTSIDVKLTVLKLNSKEKQEENVSSWKGVAKTYVVVPSPFELSCVGQGCDTVTNQSQVSRSLATLTNERHERDNQGTTSVVCNQTLNIFTAVLAITCRIAKRDNHVDHPLRQHQRCRTLNRPWLLLAAR